LVVIAARWSMYTETTVAFGGGRRVFLVDDENEKLDIETSRKVLSRALVRTVDAINALGIKVLLIGQPPEFYQDPTVCFVERWISWRDVGDCVRQPRQLVDQRLRASKAILENVAIGRSATAYVSLDSILCDDRVCRTWEDGQPLYEDTTHFDLSGARVIGNALAQMPSLASFLVPKGVSASIHASVNHLAH
jgi:SGNH domain (fused to AT3 domains)